MNAVEEHGITLVVKVGPYHVVEADVIFHGEIHIALRMGQDGTVHDFRKNMTVAVNFHGCAKIRIIFGLIAGLTEVGRSGLVRDLPKGITKTCTER